MSSQERDTRQPDTRGNKRLARGRRAGPSCRERDSSGAERAGAEIGSDQTGGKQPARHARRRKWKRSRLAVNEAINLILCDP